MSFQVGDVVEVVHAFSRAGREWIGRRLVVSGFTDEPATESIPYRFIGVRTSPPGPMGVFDGKKIADGWHPNQLRRVDPPDWSAPVETEREVSV